MATTSSPRPRTPFNSRARPPHWLAAPLVSNLGQTSAAPIQIFDDKGAAQAFVAAPDPVDFGYHFQGIRVSARGVNFLGELLIPQVRASLHGDSGGIPGARLHTLTMPLDFANTLASAEYTLLEPILKTD